MLKDQNHFTVAYVGYFYTPFADHVESIAYPIYVITDELKSKLGTLVMGISLDKGNISHGQDLIVTSKTYGLEIIVHNKRFHIPIVTLTIDIFPSVIFYTAIYPYDEALNRDLDIHNAELNIPIDIMLEFYNPDSSAAVFTLHQALCPIDILNILDRNTEYITPEDFPSLLEALGYNTIAESILKLYD